jgi:SAM-dependent methyltransferase
MALGGSGRRGQAGLTPEHDHPDPAVMFTREFWDERYGSKPKVWSGNPNPHLVAQLTGLPPGVALEVGSGEGADAVWLASQGWQVTAVDVSTVGLERAADHAAAAGPEIAGRITWRQEDILVWEPPSQQFDLVTAHFMQPPRSEREALHRRLAAAVRPGGTLLIVGHHPSDLHTSMSRPNLPDLFFTAEEVAATLDPDQWDVLLAAAPGRETVDPEGQPVTIHDAVLQATRRPT